jgi:hypothetical protein
LNPLWSGAPGGRVPAPQDGPEFAVLSHHLPGHEEGAHTGTFETQKSFFCVGNNENFKKITIIFLINNFSLFVEISRGIFWIF